MVINIFFPYKNKTNEKLIFQFIPWASLNGCKNTYAIMYNMVETNYQLCSFKGNILVENNCHLNKW